LRPQTKRSLRGGAICSDAHDANCPRLHRRPQPHTGVFRASSHSSSSPSSRTQRST
jgi:hypothetical protein